jgi:hypothetical protein
VDDISDQKLLDALKRRQERLTSVYLSSYLLGPLVAATAWRPLGLFAAAGLGFGALLAALLAVFLIARRLTASRLNLLAFERGLHSRLSPEAMKRLTIRHLRDVDGPRCVLHLQGAALPRGGMVSVVLRIDDKAAEMETHAASFSAAGVKLRRSSLPLERVQTLRERVEAGYGSLRSAARFPVRDGFPCELVIGLRAPVRVRRFECNLEDPNLDLPIVQISRALWSLAAPLVEMPWAAAPREGREPDQRGV